MNWSNLFKRSLNPSEMNAETIKKLIKEGDDRNNIYIQSLTSQMRHSNSMCQIECRENKTYINRLEQNIINLEIMVDKLESRVQFLFNHSQLRYEEDAAKLHGDK